MIADPMRTLLAVLLLVSIAVGLPVDAQKLSTAAAATPSGPPLTCIPSPTAAIGKDFHGQTLERVNFQKMDLRNANFQGAVLKGAIFIDANLTGANFSGARFVDSGRRAQVNDFSYARLESACFIGATFEAPTYFTQATLSCADFSQTDISQGNAIFGDQPLIYVPSVSGACRTAFRQTVMNCEFIDAWRDFDLSGAVLGACASQLVKRDFSNASMAGADLSKAVLDGSNLHLADLRGAKLPGASLQCAGTGAATICVDLGLARLQGADLSGANLAGADMSRASLSSDPTNPNGQPATLAGAHLRNVNLSRADLTGADFSSANFFGTLLANPSTCGSGAPGCASAQNATLVGTKFAGAYLSGVDFSQAQITAANFDGAVLVGANFANATFGQDANHKGTSFRGAYLQGTNLAAANGYLNANLANAYLDFNPNQIVIRLDGRLHNRFACATGGCTPATGADVCISVAYTAVTKVPTDDPTLTCPDGTLNAQNGCGAPVAAPSHWQSPWDINVPPEPPPAWYTDDASFTKATPGGSTARCTPNAPDSW